MSFSQGFLAPYWPSSVVWISFDLQGPMVRTFDTSLLSKELGVRSSKQFWTPGVGKITELDCC